MSKWLVEGSIRCVVEADSADEAQQILSGELFSGLDAISDEYSTGIITSEMLDD